MPTHHDVRPVARPGTPPTNPSPLDDRDPLTVDRDALRPLAERMRPRTLDDMVGSAWAWRQRHPDGYPN